MWALWHKHFVDLPVITEYLSHSIFQSLWTSKLPSPWKLTSLISQEKDVSTCAPQHFAFRKGSLGLVDHTDWMYLPSGQTLSQDVSPICLTFWTILNSPITLQGEVSIFVFLVKKNEEVLWSRKSSRYWSENKIHQTMIEMRQYFFTYFKTQKHTLKVQPLY